MRRPRRAHYDGPAPFPLSRQRPALFSRLSADVGSPVPQPVAVPSPGEVRPAGVPMRRGASDADGRGDEMKTGPDLYDRLDARLKLITRIAESGREAAKLPWDSARGRRARATVDMMLAQLKALPPVTPG